LLQKFIAIYFLLGTSLLLLGPSYAGAQVTHQPPDHISREPVFQQIESAREAGLINRDEALLNMFYSARNPDRLDPMFSELAGEPVKCLTPALILYQNNRSELLSSTRKEIEGIMASTRSTLDSEYHSKSGRFIIKYTTSGPDSVSVVDEDNSGIPDYVERAAQFADSSWKKEVAEIGYRDFILGPDQPYEIRLEDTGDNLFGFTESLGNTTRITVHRNFKGFPPNEDPEGDEIGALKVTIAHEIKHAIQFVANRWRGETANWLEMDAVLMEEVVFDDVDDYLNTITSSSSLLRNPQRSLYPGSYEDASFALYFQQKWGDQFWVDVWNNISANNSSMVDAMKHALDVGSRNASFRREFTENYFWHLNSGSQSLPDFGFEDRSKFPDLNVYETFRLNQGLITDRETIANLAAHVFTMEPANVGDQPLFIALFAPDTTTNLGWMRAADENPELFSTPGNTTTLFIKTDFQFIIDSNDQFSVVISNSHPSQAINYRLLVGTGDNIEQLPYGRVNADDTIDSTDIKTLLERRVRKIPLEPDRKFTADVTGNRKTTAYDASLILQSLQDSTLQFPADANGNGLGPEPGMFSTTNNENLAKSNKTAAESSKNAYTGTMDIAETRQDSLNFILRITNDDQRSFSSLEATLLIPDDLALENIKLTNSIWPDAMLDWHRKSGSGTTDDTLRVAIAHSEPVVEGEIAEFAFSRPESTNDDSDPVSIADARIDEGNAPLEFEKNKIFVENEDERSDLPNNFELHQNYPNPFNPSTVISYTLPQSETVNLQVYNIVGEKIATLVGGERQSSGRHEVTFDASTLASGVYLYRLEAGKFVRTKKMMLVK